MLDRKFKKAVNERSNWLVANYDHRVSLEVSHPESIFLEKIRGVGELPLWYKTGLSTDKNDKSEYVSDFKRAFGDSVANYVSNRIDYIQSSSSLSVAKNAESRRSVYYRSTYLPSADVGLLSDNAKTRVNSKAGDFLDVNLKYIKSSEYFNAENPIGYQDLNLNPQIVSYNPQKLARKFCEDYKIFQYVFFCNISRYAQANRGFRK